ncbi:hypothetical protein BD410DRAFT_842848 [Rickenella mellea]|uniref:Uncharacterized protein n=1 Tax=Rickenella mellea TaxID=50990 RepID=A0A4Y7PSM4_9AGAM|nr:hypothetical protein BD410DRAFT_842848 [Rickenella mellea]
MSSSQTPLLVDPKKNRNVISAELEQPDSKSASTVDVPTLDAASDFEFKVRLHPSSGGAQLTTLSATDSARMLGMRPHNKEWAGQSSSSTGSKMAQKSLSSTNANAKSTYQHLRLRITIPPKECKLKSPRFQANANANPNNIFADPVASLSNMTSIADPSTYPPSASAPTWWISSPAPSMPRFIPIESAQTTRQLCLRLPTGPQVWVLGRISRYYPIACASVSFAKLSAGTSAGHPRRALRRANPNHVLTPKTRAGHEDYLFYRAPDTMHNDMEWLQNITL